MIRSKRTKPRPGRLQGNALGELRSQCLERDGNRCVVCQNWVSDALPDWHDRKPHMAHIKGKRKYGDSLDNVQTECGYCHRTYHNCGPSRDKPCPSKQSVYESPDAGPEPWAEGGEK